MSACVLINRLVCAQVSWHTLDMYVRMYVCMYVCMYVQTYVYIP